MRRRVLVPVLAVLALTAGGAAFFATTATTTATCTPSPATTTGAGVVGFDVHCSVPIPTQTVTQTVTVSPTTATTTSTTAPPSTTTAPPTTTTTTTTAPPSGACAPSPSSCGYPDATNTGAHGTLTLVNPGDSGPGWHTIGTSDSVVIDGDGTVFADKLTTSDVNIQANNVTIRDVRNTSSGESLGGFAIRHGQNALIEDVTIAPPASSPRLLVGIKDIYGDANGTVIRRADISGTSTAVQMDSGTLVDSYIHDLRLQSGDHINGTTSNGGTTLLTIQHNTVFNSFDQTDAVSLFQDFGPQSNRVIDNNLLAGGGYTIYAGANAGLTSTATNIAVTNNRISRMYFPNGGSYGPLAAYQPGQGNSFTGNVWDDTGAPVQP